MKSQSCQSYPLLSIVVFIIYKYKTMSWLGLATISCCEKDSNISVDREEILA